MLGILKSLSSKVYIIATISLSSLLAASVALNKYQDDKLAEAEKREEVVRLLNISLNQAIAQLSEELRKRPNQIIEVVREVDAELCKGQSEIDGIMNLPVTRVKASTTTLPQQEVIHEQGYVDIDDAFSPEFIRMLQ